MSWQAYIDEKLTGKDIGDKAAICSVAGDSVWATSENFTVSDNEMQEIVKAFNDPGVDGIKAVSSSGISVGGEKFVTLKADDRSIYGKKGREGICIVKTTQAILISHYDESIQPNACVGAAEKLADYLITVGY